jgi:hypothetical protein
MQYVSADGRSPDTDFVLRQITLKRKIPIDLITIITRSNEEEGPRSHRSRSLACDFIHFFPSCLPRRP